MYLFKYDLKIYTMKKLLCCHASSTLLILSCQKSVSHESKDNGTEGDSTDYFQQEISLTYEVITKDTGGWFGIWTDASGNVVGTPLDSITFGSPVYNKSGWKYSFAWNGLYFTIDDVCCCKKLYMTI